MFIHFPRVASHDRQHLQNMPLFLDPVVVSDTAEHASVDDEEMDFVLDPVYFESRPSTPELSMVSTSPTNPSHDRSPNLSYSPCAVADMNSNILPTFGLSQTTVTKNADDNNKHYMNSITLDPPATAGDKISERENDGQEADEYDEFDAWFNSGAVRIIS
jgi:hypothetical protein